MWLCRPGLPNDPCTFSPAATAVTASGGHQATAFSGPARGQAAADFDCFYVYPTVSMQPTANSNLTIKRAEVAAAVAQASPFSRVCNLWAPMYRQATSASVAIGLSGEVSVLRSTFNVAYRSLLSAWQDFLASDDRGRPIILIGDSQGAAILIHLIASQIDNDPQVLRRLVLAIIAGGNLQVPAGQAVGGTFTRVPLCTRAAEAGCVIAYSAYPAQPPPDSLFGRPGQGVSLQSEQSTRAGEQVACVNPAALAGGSADLSPFFIAKTQTSLVPAVSTPWVSYPGLYSAACASHGGATWLQVASTAGPGDSRPVVTEALGPAWGYHVDDIGLALGDLVRDVAGAEAAWSSAHS